MQYSDLSSTISGILILQYVLKMDNATSLGWPLKHQTVAFSLSGNTHLRLSTIVTVVG